MTSRGGCTRRPTSSPLYCPLLAATRPGGSGHGCAYPRSLLRSGFGGTTSVDRVAESGLPGQHDGLGSIGHVELSEHVRDVVPHRLRAEVEPAGDRVVVETGCDEV